MMRRNFISNWLFLIGFCLVIAIFLPGCWSHRELNEIGIASGIGFDLSEEGKIALTVQVITPKPSTDESGKGDREPVRILTSEGETVFDAVRNLMSKSGDRVFYPHAQVIVFGAELARSGLQPVMDFLERDPELRLLTWLSITEGKAEDVIRGRSREDDIPSIHINRLIEDYRATSKVAPVSFLNYINMYYKEGVEPTIGKIEYFEKNGEPTFLMEGAGAFKEDRLIAWLDPIENRGFLWVANKVESGIVVAHRKGQGKVSNKGMNNHKDKISFEVIESKGKIKPILTGDDLSILIEVEVTANIGERMDNQSTEGKGFIQEMEELLRSQVEKEVEGIVVKAQEELQSDIFGFGLATHRKFPKYWQENKEEWDEIFPELDVEIKVKTTIKARGMII